jgi:DNA-binding LacI/PurR family transcriptional regulator
METQLPIYPGFIMNNVYDVDSAAECINKLMSLQIKPTAICCMSDMCAINSIQAAASLGLCVPKDLSFISIDDILLSRYVQPQLTTISYNKNEIGKEAAHLLMRKITGEVVESTVFQSDDILERKSVADLSK